mgnify:CR=1 FL=1
MVASRQGIGWRTNVWELTPPMAIAPAKYAKGRFVSFATAMPRGIRITNVTIKKERGWDNRNAVSPKAQGAFLPGNAFNMDFARDSAAPESSSIWPIMIPNPMGKPIPVIRDPNPLLIDVMVSMKPRLQDIPIYRLASIIDITGLILNFRTKNNMIAIDMAKFTANVIPLI